MADDLVLNAGVGGATVSADELAGSIYVQRVKVQTGADGVAVDAAPVSNGMDVAGSTVPAAGLVGQLDDAATGAVTENQFAPVRISARRALLVEGVASGTAVPISAAALPLPTGAASEAKQDTQITAEQAIQAAVQIMDDWDESDRAKVNLIAGQAGIAGGTGVDAATVPRVSLATNVPLPAGTNAIGKLAANSGVDIGDVDILSIAAGDNNIGNVDVLSVIPGTGATNLGKAIDTATGATDTGVLALATRDDALGALTPVEGDNVALRTDANGALWVHDDALDAALAGNELQVDIVAALPAGTNAIGKLAANSGVDIGDVDVTSCALPTGASTEATVAAAAASLSVMDDWDNAASDGASVSGDVAHDAADAGEPVKIGGRADTTFQAAAADGDRVNALFDVYGVQEVRTDHPNKWSYHDDDVAAVTTDGTVQAAPGAGLSVYITDVIFSIGAATASGIFLEESTTKILGIYYLEAIAGRSLHMRFATPKKCTANTAILVTNTGSISFGIDILGFIAP